MKRRSLATKAIRVLTMTHIGSGSGQQSVTGFPNADDGNSFWIVEASSGKNCKRG